MVKLAKRLPDKKNVDNFRIVNILQSDAGLI